MGTRSLWKDFSAKQFYLYRTPDDTQPLVLEPNACITWDQRKDYVKIVKVFGIDTEEGPRGFTYLPYRHSENRWATPIVSMRGDNRFVICYPAGFPHYGLHITMNTIQVDDVPLFNGTPGIISLTGKIGNYTILEMRHKILKMCETESISNVCQGTTYHCSKNDVKFVIIISRMSETLEDGLRIDIYYEKGDKNMVYKYSDHFDLYLIQRNDISS